MDNSRTLHHRLLSILFMNCAIIALIMGPAYAQAVKPTPTKKALHSAGKTQPQPSAKQQAPVKYLDKFDEKIAYQIWEYWYHVQSPAQGGSLRLPIINIGTGDPKEDDRLMGL